MTTLAEYKDIAAEQALERAVFRWRPHDEGVNPFDEVGPAAAHGRADARALALRL
jgi:hypothetical protein